MLTHLDQNANPTMVDVSGKATSTRTARARVLVQLPEALRPYLAGEELTVKKGPVFQTAIIAGTMAAKRTHELIPFCHQIPLESCKFQVTINEALVVTIECTVKTTFKTGVEMEALSGASAAALTIYDMCKAVSHEIVIRETKLLAKTGGKRTVLDRPLYGLVLTGGKSSRMKWDKALIAHHGAPHAVYLRELLGEYCAEVYLSARPGQWAGTVLEGLPEILDPPGVQGPIAGLLAAFERHPDANWLVVACDLVHFNRSAVEALLQHFDPACVATAFRNRDMGFPEALGALYTPAAGELFREAWSRGVICPVKALRGQPVCALEAGEAVNLANINTPEELAEVQREVG